VYQLRKCPSITAEPPPATRSRPVCGGRFDSRTPLRMHAVVGTRARRRGARPAPADTVAALFAACLLRLVHGLVWNSFGSPPVLGAPVGAEVLELILSFVVYGYRRMPRMKEGCRTPNARGEQEHDKAPSLRAGKPTHPAGGESTNTGHPKEKGSWNRATTPRNGSRSGVQRMPSLLFFFSRMSRIASIFARSPPSC